MQNVLVQRLLRIPLGSGDCQDLPSGGGGRDEPVVEIHRLKTTTIILPSRKENRTKELTSMNTTTFLVNFV